MTRSLTSLLLLAATACAPAARRVPAAPVAPVGIAALPHSPADVHFMTGMIHHHAQAVLIAKWAPSHGASDELQRLAVRIVVGQNDEIALMQNWLRDKKEPVPEATAGPMRMRMDGMTHEMLMPGMLTDAQLAQLDAARGVEFDRLFLTFMIQHHEGAIKMVDDLFKVKGAGQEVDANIFANDVVSAQTAEIGIMRGLLAKLPPK